VTTTPQSDAPRGEVLPPLGEKRPASGWKGYLLASIGALVSALYLANIGAGIVEIGPDNLPGIGNLDEFLFSLLLIYCLRTLGIDLLPYLRRGRGTPKN
jgi:hypothetical protein